MAGKGLSGRFKAKLLFAGLAIVLVCGSGLIWYFSFYTKTPDYALKMVQESIVKHDTVKFHKYVDEDKLLAGVCDALMQGIIESERPMPEEAKVALSGFAKMFKAPLINSFKGSLNQYVENGKWGNDDSKSVDQGIPIDSDMIIEKSGVKDLQFEAIDYMAVDKEEKTAVAGVRVLQGESGESFVFEVELRQSEDGVWRVVNIKNFRDFVGLVSQSRRDLVQEYISVTQSLMEEHEKKIRLIEKKAKETLASGSLGNQATRDALKAIMQEELEPEWTARKNELEAVDVPPAAGTLQRLRLKICDLRIAYCQKYAKWLENKDAKTLKDANESLKEAKTLEHEALVIVGRIKAGQAEE